MKTLSIIVIGVILSISSCKDDEEILPACMREKIAEIQDEYGFSPPEGVYRILTTQGKTYYYIPVHCCDFPSELYDKECNLICNPDGGYTGGGSGDCPDYTIKTKVLVHKFTVEK